MDAKDIPEFMERLGEHTRRSRMAQEWRQARAYHHIEVRDDPQGWQGQRCRIELHDHSGISYSVNKITPVEALELRDKLTTYLAGFDEADLERQARHLMSIRTELGI